MGADVFHAVYRNRDCWECTCGGSVIETRGRWTGRRMMECVDCGAYEVVSENDDTRDVCMPGFADVVEHEGHEIVVQPIGRGPTVVQIVCRPCRTVLVEVDNPATCPGLTEDEADTLAAVVVEDARDREFERLLTEEAPRPLADLVADALDVVERCAELDYATAQIAAPALSWQMQRLARQVAEVTQHIATQHAEARS